MSISETLMVLCPESEGRGLLNKNNHILRDQYHNRGDGEEGRDEGRGEMRRDEGRDEGRDEMRDKG